MGQNANEQVKRIATPFVKFIWFISRIIVTSLAKLWLKVRFEGCENIPKTGPVILISNHISHLDPPLIGCALQGRYAAFIAKEELFDKPFLKWWMRAIKQISIKRGAGGTEALNTALQYLKAGEIVIMFPEGTRSETGRIGQFKSGASILAMRSAAPILPCGISHTNKAFSKGSKRILPYWKTGYPVVVRFGKPFKVTETPKNADWFDKAELRKISAKFREEIIPLLHPDHQPVDENSTKTTGF